MNDRARAKRSAPLLVRRRLLKRLAGAWKVAVLSAPAGYGKTTLAAQYSAKRTALWCRLEREDRDLAHLLGKLIASGQRFKPPILRRTERLFHARRDLERDGGVILESLFSELTPSRGSVLLVLEDAHVLAGAREVLSWLRRLIEETPPRLRLLLTCRGAPPLPLARYELKEGVVQIGPDELEFDDDEQARFLATSSARSALEDPRTASLRASLRGWPAGFALLVGSGASSRVPRVDPGAEDEARRGRLFRYLAEEIFVPLPLALRRDLCRASLLDDLEPVALADLLGARAATRLLNEARLHELLVRGLPERPKVTAFHPLFREFLKERRSELLSAAELRALGRRLGRSLLKAGEAARAIRVHLECDDTASAVELFDREACRTEQRTTAAPLIPIAMELLRDAPAGSPARRSPHLLSAAASGTFREGRFTDAIALVEEASELWLARRAYLELARDARLAAACAWVTGRAKAIRPRLEALLHRCPQRERVARAILRAEIGGLRILGGQPDRARTDLAAAERVLRGTPHERHLVEVRIQRANLLYSQGDWEQYLEIAHRALAFYRRVGVPGRVQALLINMAEAHTYLGEEERALSMLDEAEAMQSHVMQQNAGLIHLGRARALVERGDVGAATQALASARDSASKQGSRLWEMEADLWSAVIDRKQGQLEAAERTLLRTVEGFREMDAPAWANLAAMELGLVLGLRRRTGALRLLRHAASDSRRLGDSKEVARNLLYQARVLDAAGEDARSTLARALRSLERERYLVLLRKESDVVRALTRRVDELPATLRALVRTANPQPAPGARKQEITVRLLGGMAVEVDGRNVSFARRASMELLARLALRAGEPLRREDLAESLSPGASPESSRNRFDVALSGLRRLLEPNAGPRGPFRVLESAAGWCRLAVDAAKVDAREFEALAQQCEVHLRGLSETRLRRAEQDLAAAMLHYRGDLLPEFAQAEWAERERERLRTRFRRLVLGHAVVCLRLGDPKKAEADAQRVLAEDPLDESAQQLLLGSLAARREHLQVIRCYRGFEKRMRRELGVQPSPKTAALFEASRRVVSERTPSR